MSDTLIIRALKKEPAYEYVMVVDEEDDGGLRFERQYNSIKGRLSTLGHGMNKNEAKALRRIMSRTGLTEPQVREHKKYRQELALAAGPQHRTQQTQERQLLKYDPLLAIKDPLERDKARFAASIYLDVNNRHFPRLWANELKRRVEQAIIDKLSLPL